LPRSERRFSPSRNLDLILMNVVPPSELPAVRPVSGLGRMLGRTFMLTNELPPDIARCLQRLSGERRAVDPVAQRVDYDAVKRAWERLGR
jgi:hypothetical protein